uniref:Uncharacterized protein n=1 Tax=Caenorhabditis japonica TaxID=281687 RepID=A0A8R1DJT1_CAEJA
MPIIFAVAVVAGFIPGALGSLILQSNLKTLFGGLESKLADLKESRKLNAERLESIRKAQEVMARQLSDEEWQEFEDSFFEKSNIEKVFKFLKIDPDQVLRNFQIPQSLGTDIFRTFTYETQCGTNFDTVELKVCYRSSDSRKVGSVVKLAPRGKFIHGKIFRYWETPNYGIITNDGLVSADRCKRIGGLYACEQSSANCTYYETAECVSEN